MGNCFRDIIYSVSPCSRLFKIKDCMWVLPSGMWVQCGFIAEVNFLRALLHIYSDVTDVKILPCSSYIIFNSCIIIIITVV